MPAFGDWVQLVALILCIVSKSDQPVIRLAALLSAHPESGWRGKDLSSCNNNFNKVAWPGDYNALKKTEHEPRCMTPPWHDA
jgi:hypothetical protein